MGIVVVAVLGLVIAWVAMGPSSSNQLPPFTATDAQAKVECLTGTYVPSLPAGEKLAESPVPKDWSTVEDAKRSMQPDRSVVQVTLTPEHPGEEVTLEGIHFEVVPKPLRPLGTVFFRPCKRKIVGPAVEADLGQNGHIDASNADLNGTLGTGLRLPDSAEPIRFPWTVRLDKPLHLYLIVHSESFYGIWGARIPWSSDSSEGVIHIDNGGKRYRQSDTIGLIWDRPVNGHWVRGSAPAWIGVR